MPLEDLRKASGIGFLKNRKNRFLSERPWVLATRDLALGCLSLCLRSPHVRLEGRLVHGTLSEGGAPGS